MAPRNLALQRRTRVRQQHEQEGCNGEIVWEGRACWAVCARHPNWRGTPRASSAEAQADGDAHERFEWTRAQMRREGER